MGIGDDEFWADFFGVAPTAWAEVGASVQPHAGLSGYRGFWCFRRNQRTIISAPPAWMARLAEVTAEAPDHDLLLPTFWERALPQDLDRVIGPAFQGCLEPGKFRPRSNASVRALEDHDAPAVEEFRTACGEDWNMPNDAELFRHAYLDGGTITAMAGYRAWSDKAGDACVITRPTARGRGCGTAVTSAVVAEALSNEKLLLYQTLESNAPAVRIALSLGYDRYANHLAVRLRQDLPP
jgi:GNAT superfamily N-acetyltransferase